MCACEVISFKLQTFVITQDGDSALTMAAKGWGRTEVVSQLLEAGANTDLQNKVKCHLMVYSRNCLV